MSAAILSQPHRSTQQHSSSTMSWQGEYAAAGPPSSSAGSALSLGAAGAALSPPLPAPPLRGSGNVDTAPSRARQPDSERCGTHGFVLGDASADACSFFPAPNRAPLQLDSDVLHSTTARSCLVIVLLLQFVSDTPPTSSLRLIQLSLVPCAAASGNVAVARCPSHGTAMSPATCCAPDLHRT